MDRALRFSPPLVLRIHPRDGATGVFRDATIVACLSHAADVASVSADTFRVLEPGGVAVPGRLSLSADRSLVIWTAGRLLTPGVEHVVRAEGLRDARGLPLRPCVSRFVPCDLVHGDVSD
jgi:hypothetical protein